MNKIITFFSCFIIVMSILSCSSNTTTSNSDKLIESYIALSEGQTDIAKDLLLQVEKKEPITTAKLAFEKLIPLLYHEKEYNEVLKRVEKQLGEQAQNATIYQINSNFLQRYKILSSIALQKEGIQNELQGWILTSDMSLEHTAFFDEGVFKNYYSAGNIDTSLMDEIEIRSAVFKRDYGQAIRNIVASTEYIKESPETFFEDKGSRYLSDLGKATLYGSNDNDFFARAFETAAQTYPEKSTEAFMCYFYAGRLFEERGHTNAALDSFERAMNASINDENYDNALWYYLTSVRKVSSRSAITSLQEYAPLWNDPYYFDDFLESLAFQLLDNENYKGFYALYQVLKPYISPIGLSKYAYISALLIEQEYIEEQGNREAIIRNLYETAYSADNGSLYYRIMASVPLNISTSKVLRDLLAREEQEANYDKVFETTLNDMVSAGFIGDAYTLYTRNSDIVSLEGAVVLSQALSRVNNPLLENNYSKNYYPESLRLASRAFSESGKDISKEDMKLLYPRYYSDIVTQTSQVYGLEEFIIYAIIRSESFFDHDVMSWAGAIGLTQLMPTTAGDVARKLKVKDYDLHNVRQNIDFGMFYFDELIPREGVDNSILRALFSYNAGITNVRRWNRQFPELKDSPTLFLEKIPFAETREYGRKILSAGVMYGVLYYDMEVSDVVQAIMN